jgi:hypothetical protein
MPLTKDLVQLVKGRLGEDDKATQMTTRSQLQEVEAVHAGNLHTGKVPANNRHHNTRTATAAEFAMKPTHHQERNARSNDACTICAVLLHQWLLLKAVASDSWA